MKFIIYQICIIDTGYDLGHPDLPEVGVTGYEDSLDKPDGTTGHGTHVAGTVGAIGNNAIGVMGVLPDPTTFNFHIVRALSEPRVSLADSIRSCVDNDAHVINMSLGKYTQSDEEAEAAQVAYDEGVLLIAAAGNCGEGGEDYYRYPAADPHVMSVTAVDKNRELYQMTVPRKPTKKCSTLLPSGNQHNDQVEISAPGVDVWSTIPRNGGEDADAYGSKTGTSMAAPHVAGVAALVWSYFPNCTNFQIRTALISSASEQGTEGCDEYYGHGIVNAKAAYDLLKNGDCGGIPKKEGTDAAVGGCKQFTVSFNKTADYSNLGPYAFVDHNQFDDDDDEFYD